MTAVATSNLVDLRQHASWEPSRLLAEVFEWPIAVPIVALRDLVSRVAPTSIADVGTPVITPAGIDSILGGVRRRSRKYQGAAYQVGSELRPGDVLVPRTPSGVALIVSELMAGALVSSTFYALRPGDQMSGLWIWGMLNCRSGIELRRSVSVGAASMLLSTGDLLDLPVPMPPLVAQSALMAGLHEAQAATRVPEDEAPETWWRIADLRASEWRLMLASPRPELLQDGTPLRDYCGEIARGRPVRDFASESEEIGFLPVVDIGTLSGNPSRRWVPATADRLTRVHPGDLCVAAVGERPHAAVVDADAVADPNVYVLRLRDPSLGPALMRYLNGREGYAFRRMLISGAAMPSLRRRDLEQLPVRKHAFDSPEAETPVASLADRLEQVLWSS